MKSIAVSIDKYESLLQHRGPPFLEILSKDKEVILFDNWNSLVVKGVDLVIIEIAIPELMAAPHAPQ